MTRTPDELLDEMLVADPTRRAELRAQHPELAADFDALEAGDAMVRALAEAELSGAEPVGLSRGRRASVLDAVRRQRAAQRPANVLTLASWVRPGTAARAPEVALATAAADDAPWTQDGVEAGTYPDLLEVRLRAEYDGQRGHVRVSWRGGVPNPPGWRLTLGLVGGPQKVFELTAGDPGGELVLGEADLGFDPLSGPLAYRFEAL